MKIIKDHEVFWSKVDPLIDLDFGLVDIVPDTRFGYFLRNRLNEMQKFCKTNPEFHVISVFGIVNIIVNAPLESAPIYMLGAGDSDPELTYIPPYATSETLKELQILKFFRNKRYP